MDLSLVVFGFIVIIVFFHLSGNCLANKWYDLTVSFVALGSILSFLLIAGVLTEYPTGVPIKNISVGEYKVGKVYVAGDNVNVSIETERDNKKEYIKHYQFNKNAFEGEIREGAKKLVVTESGDFKKLRLE